MNMFYHIFPEHILSVSPQKNWFKQFDISKKLMEKSIYLFHISIY